MWIFTWPFLFAGGLIAFILSAVGRVFAFGMGVAVAMVGVVLCMTFIGAVIGVPLVLFGGGLIVRSMF